MSITQKDVGSRYMRVMQAFGSRKPRCQFCFVSFSAGYVTNKGCMLENESCRSSIETAKVCLLKCDCIHNRFNLVLNKTLHTVNPYLQRSLKSAFIFLSASINSSLSSVVLLGYKLQHLTMNMFLSPWATAGLQLWCCRKRSNSCGPASSPTSAPSWMPWWSPPAKVSPRSGTFSSGSWWRSARTR